MSRRAGLSLAAALALLAFAGNSLLCRLALRTDRIDPLDFTLIRLAAGALTLVLLRAMSRAKQPLRRDLVSPLLLLGYAAPFSLAYVTLGAGTGALVLFGSVQATMLAVALATGERFRVPEAIGLVLALVGLVTLVLPGLSAPPLLGCALMVLAGVAWGFYSLRGRGSTDPLGETMRNFVLAAPAAAVLCLFGLRGAHASAYGVACAVASGAVTSGVGYALWFAALRKLTAIHAATIQLAVPVIAAIAGVAFLGERLSWRLVIAAALILGGIAWAIAGRAQAARPTVAPER